MNINVGGYKGFTKFPETIRNQWKILDVEPRADFVHNLNSQELLPFDDKSVDNYYASMILEHVAPSNLPFVFSELHRTLKTGGLIRIVVPDMKVGITAYINGDSLLFSSEGPTPDADYPPTNLGRLMGWWFTKNRTVKDAERDGHKMAYDWPTLSYYLTQARFQDITRKRYADCSDVFKGKDFRRYMRWALYAEASK